MGRVVSGAIAAVAVAMALAGCMRDEPRTAVPTPTVERGQANPTNGPTADPSVTAGAATTTATAGSTPLPTTDPGSQAGASPTATAIPSRSFQSIPASPDRDLYELGRRLRLKQVEEVWRFADPLPARLNVGDEITWSVNRDSGNEDVRARVLAVSEHAYWVFDTEFIPDDIDLEAAVEEFEQNTWPAVTGAFGEPWTPGVDGDPRIVVFHSALRSGVAGYYSSADEYPKAIVPTSNERETIYMSATYTPGTPRYNGVLAHELQHAVHWAYDPSEESWINEGMSEYASLLAGYPPGSVNEFVRSPGVSLTEWASNISAAGANYGSAAMFIEYLADHYGGAELISALVNEPLDGYESVDATLAALGHAETFEDVFEDWVIANYLDEASGPYSYPNRDVKPVLTANLSMSTETTSNGKPTGSVRPFGTDYYDVASALGDVRLEFSGDPTAPIFGVAPYSGDTCWWTNAGDSINSRLVRAVDLRAVDTATFMFWAWYDIERDWDYAYVTVSTDGGSTWETVSTGQTTSRDPNGNSYGHGLTGQTNGWEQDEADLSDYAGREVLLAIEYITDDAVHERGGCFDNFSIPQISWFDDTSSDGGWTSEGFARIGNLQVQEYLVQVIRERVGEPVEVVRVPVDGTGRGALVLQDVAQNELVTVVVSAVQRGVTGSADYTVELRRE